MKKLLIADDENLVLEGLQFLVSRELGHEFTVVGTASSGSEAVTKVLALQPDIVLMDVDMPSLSGLEAIRELRKKQVQAEFILVTAYERFDIAREAVELGVFDYLLKPVGRDRLVQTLLGVAQNVERRQEVDRLEQALREGQEVRRHLAEAALLKGILLGEALPADLSPYRQLLGLQTAGGMMFVLTCEGSDPRDLHRRVREVLKFKTAALFGPLLHTSAIGLWPLRQADQAEAAARELKALVEQNFAAETAAGGLTLRCGPFAPMDRLPESYAAALLPAEKDLPSSHDLELDLLEALQARGLDQASVLLDKLLAGQTWDQPADRLRLASLLAAGLRLFVLRSGLNTRQLGPELDALLFSPAESGAAFAAACRASLARLTQLLAGTVRWSPPLEKALAWLRQHFAEPVSLEQAASETGRSPSRLSRLFVEETGRGFSEWLIDLRLARAKELLLVPGASVKEVSLAVGYPDPNYFSRLFKRVTGQTPTEYAGLPARLD